MVFYLSESLIKNKHPKSNKIQPAKRGLLIGLCFIASTVKNIQPIIKVEEPKKYS